MGPTVGLIAAVVGAATSVYGTVQSVKAQKKASRARRQQEALASRKSRRQAIREAQIKRAQSLSTAQGAGALQSSGAQGGIGGISSQLGSELGFASQMSGLSDIVSQQSFKAQQMGDLAGLGAKALSFGIGQGAFDKRVSPEPTSPAAAQGNFVSAWTPGQVRPQARPF